MGSPFSLKGASVMSVHPLDFAGLQAVDRGDDLHTRDILEDRIMVDLIGDTDGVGLDRVVEQVTRFGSGSRHGRLDLIHNAVDVGRYRTARDGRLDGPAVLVTQNDHETYAEVFDEVLDASESDIIDHIAGGADDGDPVEVLVEDVLGGGACIRAGYDHSDRVLSVDG